MAHKKDFFKDLYDEGSDREGAARASKYLKTKQKTRCRTSRNEGQPHGLKQGSLQRTVHTHSSTSTPQPLKDDSFSDETEAAHNQGKGGGIPLGHPTKVKFHQSTKTSVSQSFESAAMPEPKRDRDMRRLPEQERIFLGKKFYFLPDNDISQGRRLRIQKAEQFGAQWVKEWIPDFITHIIVDNGINYADVLKYLKLGSLPRKIIMVKQDYPGHCIMYKHLVNPDQPQYRVPGSVLEPQTETGPLASSEDHSAKSLQLKHKRQHTGQTPTPTQGSDESVASRELRLLAKQPESKSRAAHRPFRDVLEEAIDEARALESLPLDDSDHEASLSDDVYAPESETSWGKMRERKDTDRISRGDRQENFNCMHKHDTAIGSDNPNRETIEILQKMYNYYESVQDHWRSLAYRKAIVALKKQTKKITNKEDARAIPYVGDRLAQKIEEIVWTGRLQRLENTALEPNDHALQTFLKIYGVGYKQASAFVAQGHRTLEDLKLKASLTNNQRIGIEHYDDFQSRIPREEVTRHGAYVRKMLDQISSDIEVQIAGSYRRGSSESGDVDFIITTRGMPTAALRTLIIQDLIPRLFAGNYLKCGLSITSSETGTKWHGAACLPGGSLWRRIDFLLVPHEEYGAALIYFTGNDIFNRSIRLLASKKGMGLNQRGLWRNVIRGQGRERITQGTLVESKNERAIFEALGVPWRPPEHRNC